MTRLGAAIFDMDGTLLDSEQLYLRAFRQAREAVGVDAPDALFRQLIGMDHVRSRIVLEEALGDGVEAFTQGWDTAIKPLMVGPIPVKHTVLDLLSALQGRAPMAVATSTRRAEAERRLAKAGLLDFFDAVIGGDEVANGKPAPDIFLLAANRLGVAPEACVAFEDSENGTKAALAAKMHVVQVPDLVPAQNPDGGQIVAPDVMAGAQMTGLMERL